MTYVTKVGCHGKLRNIKKARFVRLKKIKKISKLSRAESKTFQVLEKIAEPSKKDMKFEKKKSSEFIAPAKELKIEVAA